MTRKSAKTTPAFVLLEDTKTGERRWVLNVPGRITVLELASAIMIGAIVGIMTAITGHRLGHTSLSSLVIIGTLAITLTVVGTIAALRFLGNRRPH